MSDVSVVIRCKDEAPSIGRVLDVLDGQTVRPQVIVVDSGSTDGTLDILRPRDLELVEIPAASFTYGGALNTGTERASAEVVVALSAHSFPRDDRWLEHVLDAMAEPDVACASGQGVGPDGAPLTARMRQDQAIARAHPLWGYSSHAGAFRRSLWAQHPFRADMPFSEDKEWAWHWLHRGLTVVLDPALVVDHGHGGDPLREQWRREYLQWKGHAMYRRVEPPDGVALLRTWWSDREGYDSTLRARLSPKRLARLAGSYVGQRAAARS